MPLENLLGNFIIHLLFLFITTSNVRFADSADCHNKVIVSVPRICMLENHGFTYPRFFLQTLAQGGGINAGASEPVRQVRPKPHQ